MQESKTPSRRHGEHEQPMIKVVDLEKSFAERPVLQGVSFKVWAGETLGIVGPSGCGKSTVLKLLTGLLDKDGGEIILRTDDIGLVFQGSALLNSLTVRQNLELPLRHMKLSKREKEEKIVRTLKLTGLADLIDSYPAQLSGGQQKRTSFARAVVNEPKIILYDEPTTGLDPVMSTIIEDYMIDLESQLKAASIVVTHQFSTWSRTADRIVMLHAGHVVWEGNPEEAVSSTNPYVEQFVKASRDGPMQPV
jgi:phospholipid/cholesterol/gamma-HCH transport system ATP-binding protein